MIALTETLLCEYKISYILLDAQQQILEYGGNIFSKKDKSASLYELIPELMGCEDILQAILDKEIPNFEMEDINRYEDGEEEDITYLTIHIEPYLQYYEPQLLVTLQDMSRYARVQQSLTQQRNELFLLKQSLDDTNQRLKYIMQRYVPQKVGEALMNNRQMPSLGGNTQEITTLFVDLCDYTHISEQQTPEETLEMLHIFMDITCAAIIDAGGVVVNYMGDAVMAIFNAPDPLEEHASHAVKAAIDMQIHASQSLQNQWSFYFSVGINTGQALIGNIGTQQHYQYTAVGDVVNIASRICSHAHAGEILIGHETYLQANEINSIGVKALPPVTFKGKSKSIPVYSITDI